jgi:hypothetical protein
VAFGEVMVMVVVCRTGATPGGFEEEPSDWATGLTEPHLQFPGQTHMPEIRIQSSHFFIPLLITCTYVADGDIVMRFATSASVS